MKIEPTEAPLLFAHIGDLHITNAAMQNYKDLLSIISQIEVQISEQLDFVIFPGDNADNGLPEQYALIAAALKMLSVPVYMLAGDHDMEQGSLDNFYQMPFTKQLPFSSVHKGNRCIFIDVCGFGKGGPDFRIGSAQLKWLENELITARDAQEEIVLFMHTYPADLQDAEEKDLLNKLIKDYLVMLVDMGHTHYNEISNNGNTLFTATRSTGQIDEGAVGYSLVSVDKGTVSWRFKQLADPFPFVIITSPADYRILSHKRKKNEVQLNVSAMVLGANDVHKVECLTAGNRKKIMEFNKLNKTWHTSVQPDDTVEAITVNAVDVTGRPGMWCIQPAKRGFSMSESLLDGSDADSIGAWPENGIPGTQLGPNKNARPSLTPSK